MSEIPSVPPSRSPAQTNRLPLLLVILAAVIFVTILPYAMEQASYSLKRGELKAESEAAGAELARLGNDAELVQLSDTSRAFRLVARRVGPRIIRSSGGDWSWGYRCRRV